MPTTKKVIRHPRNLKTVAEPQLPMTDPRIEDFLYRGIHFRLVPEAGMSISQAYRALDAAVAAGGDIKHFCVSVRDDPRPDTKAAP